jgi:hypothetical protein
LLTTGTKKKKPEVFVSGSALKSGSAGTKISQTAEKLLPIKIALKK